MLNKIQEKQEEQEYKDVEARANLARTKQTMMKPQKFVLQSIFAINGDKLILHPSRSCVCA